MSEDIGTHEILFRFVQQCSCLLLDMRAGKDGFETEVLIGRDGRETQKIRIAVPVDDSPRAFCKKEDRPVQLIDVYEGRIGLDQFLSKLSLGSGLS